MLVQLVESMFSIVESIAVVFASIAAFKGIREWRKEAKWKREYELAEEALALFYDAGERLKKIRFHGGLMSEGSTRKKSEYETPEQTRILNDGYVGFERYEREKEPFLKLKNLKFKFGVVFGEKAKEPFERLDSLLMQIFRAYTRRTELNLATLKGFSMEQLSESQIKQRWEQAEKDNAVIWSGYDNDPVQEQLDEIIKQLEDICKPRVSQRY
jgi:hypothetical protein